MPLDLMSRGMAVWALSPLKHTCAGSAATCGRLGTALVVYSNNHEQGLAQAERCEGGFQRAPSSTLPEAAYLS